MQKVINRLSFPDQNSFIVNKRNSSAYSNFVSDAGTRLPEDTPVYNNTESGTIPRNQQQYAKDVVYNGVSGNYVSMLPTRDQISNMSCSELSASITTMFKRIEELTDINLKGDYYAMIAFAEENHKNKKCSVIYKDTPPVTTPVNSEVIDETKISAAMPLGLQGNQVADNEIKKPFPWVTVIIAAGVLIGLGGVYMLVKK